MNHVRNLDINKNFNNWDTSTFEVLFYNTPIYIGSFKECKSVYHDLSKLSYEDFLVSLKELVDRA